MTSLAVRTETLDLIKEAVDAGARQVRACEIVGLPARTLQRWRKWPEQGDRRPQRVQSPANAATVREHILRGVADGTPIHIEDFQHVGWVKRAGYEVAYFFYKLAMRIFAIGYA